MRILIGIIIGIALLNIIGRVYANGIEAGAKYQEMYGEEFDATTIKDKATGMAMRKMKFV